MASDGIKKRNTVQKVIYLASLSSHHTGIVSGFTFGITSYLKKAESEWKDGSISKSVILPGSACFPLCLPVFVLTTICLPDYCLLSEIRSQEYVLETHPKNIKAFCLSRSFASRTSKEPGKQNNKAKKEVTTVEDPFDSPTYHILEKPVTFTEGASYSLVILAGLGVAGAAGYAVFKELIFQPKEYKIFDKALKRIQDEGQVRVRIGSPIKGYGQETRNRAARQRIPNRVFTDEDGVEHVEVNFYIRGPQGAGKVYTEMFKDKTENEWKYTYLIVEILTPSPAKLMLESYLPA